MPKIDFDPHIAGPRVNAGHLVMAVFFLVMIPLMRLGLGASGIADFESDDFDASLSALILMEVGCTILIAYLLTVATGAFEVCITSGRFFAQDFIASLTFGLGMLAIRYSRTPPILWAYPPEITHGAADAPLSWSRLLQTPRILIHRWLPGTSPLLLFQ